jgi:hypothetical protein
MPVTAAEIAAFYEGVSRGTAGPNAPEIEVHTVATAAMCRVALAAHTPKGGASE